MKRGSLDTLLVAAWDEAANSKDQVEHRARQLSSMVSLLTECHDQPWFEQCIADQIKRTYPKPYRCLLDAVLQAFVAASPLHCGPVLQGFMHIPGCVTLNSPFRRDLAALFKSTMQLQSCWPQQGVVVCSIIACLATAATTQLWELSQHQQSLDTQHRQQELGTTLSWLVDCLLHALPSQLLTLMRLVLASAVFQANKRTAVQQEGQRYAAMHHSTTDTPPAKKLRLGQPQHHHHHHQQQQQQQQQRGTEAASSASTADLSQEAIQLGMQLLTALCCCEHVQHNSRRLVPYAAAVAASAAVGTTEHGIQAVRHGSWLYRQLCSQVSLKPAGSSTGCIIVAASAATASNTPSSIGVQQELTPDTLQPYTGLVHVLQQLIEHSPVLVLEFVRVTMGLPQSEITQSAAAVSGQLAAAASLSKPESSHINSLFPQQLVQAARQWLPVAEAAPGHSKKQHGKKGGKQQQQDKPSALQKLPALQSDVITGVSIVQAPALLVKQVLPDTANVNATWVCKHVVPILVQAAHAQWSQQHQQQRVLRQDPIVQVRTAAAALVQLLSVEGLLLPAAGEVLVSARVLAEALNSLQADLQCIVADGWRQQLQQQGGAAGEAAAGCRQPGCCVAWKVLQPMLCLLSSLQQNSPFADLLVECVQRCIYSYPAASTSARASTSTSSARDIVQHILLPVRFGLKMPARVWLLQQLLRKQRQSECAAVEGVDPAAVSLTVLSNLLRTDWQKQLVQGLQLLAKQQQQQSGMPDGKTAALSLQQTQEMGLAAALTGLLQALDGANTDVVSAAACVANEGDWQSQVADQLRVVLQAADAAAYEAVMLASPLQTRVL